MNINLVDLTGWGTWNSKFDADIICSRMGGSASTLQWRKACKPGRKVKLSARRKLTKADLSVKLES